MIRKIFLATLIFLFFLALTALAEEKKLKKYAQAQYLMGTIFRIELYSESQTKAQKALALAFQEIKKMELIMSNYLPESEAMTLVKVATDRPRKVSPELYEVLEKALYFSKISGGKFDLTVEPLLNLWGFKYRNYHLPSKDEIALVLKKIGYHKISLDRGYVYLKEKGLTLDFGAIGKGFALDKASEVLKKAGITSAIIDSVSSIICIGSPPGENYWPVYLKNPEKEEEIIYQLKLKDQALSTSGDSEQFFFIKEKKYSHILNPKTGYPIEENGSVTVITAQAIEADALSTILMLSNEQEIIDLKKIKNFRAIKVLKKNKDYQLQEF